MESLLMNPIAQVYYIAVFQLYFILQIETVQYCKSYVKVVIYKDKECIVYY